MAENDSKGPDAPVDTARYISSMAKELRALATRANLGFLAYLLAMAEDEAHSVVRRLGEGR